MLKLFSQITKGTKFHFGDRPDRELVKEDDTHYVAPEGRHSAHPHVLVIQSKSKPNGGTPAITDEPKGE